MSLLSQFSAGGVTNNVILNVEIFGVGGGGGGGTGAPPASPAGEQVFGGGGGAGAVLYQRLQVTPGITYTISIGAGGAGGISSTSVPPRYGSIGNNTYFGNNFIGGGGGGGGTIPSGVVPKGAGGIEALGSSGGTSISNLNTNSVQNSQHYVNGIISVVSNGDLTSFNYLANESIPVLSTPGGGALADSQGGGGASGRYKFESGAGGGIAGFLGMDGVPAAVIGISTIAVGGGGNSDYRAAFDPWAFPILGGGGDKNGGNGTANTGGGGGASRGGDPDPTSVPGGSGGSGVLFVRYPTQYAAATVTGNTTAPSQPGYYVYRWNSGPGTIVFN